MPTFKRRDQEEFEKAKDLLEGAPVAEMGFVKSLFFGRLNLEKIMPYPKQDPADAQRTEDLLSNLEMFLKSEVNADEIDKTERIPRSIVDGLGKLGVLGMTVPKEFGGGAYSQTAYCRALELVSRYCASTAVLIGAHQSIGLNALVLMGKDETKKQYLPDLATGQQLTAFCMSYTE